MFKTFKYRLLPSKSQASELLNQFELCRFLYNSALEERIGAWKKQRVSLNYYTQAVQLPEIKKVFPELNQVYSQVLQNVLQKLDLSFKAFFKRHSKGVGFPRFKGKNRIKSITYSQLPVNFLISLNTIRVPKIGDIHIKLHRQLPSKPKRMTVKCINGKWFVMFLCEIEVEPRLNAGPIIGLDAGFTHLLTDSNGRHYENFRFYKRFEQRLARVQRRFSKSKTSKNLNSLHRTHDKITNSRLNSCHQLTKKLVDDYSLITIEDLNLTKIAVKLGKSTCDAALGLIFFQLEYKAEEAGCRVVKVNPAYTSQLCSQCGQIKPKDLSVRWHSCDCGASLCRDHNAAINILTLGTQSLAKA